jgi:hypothetical protein
LDWFCHLHEPTNAQYCRSSTQGTEVVSTNQNAAFFCQGDHLLWGRGGIEDPLKVRVTIHQVAEVIQGIQQ